VRDGVPDFGAEDAGVGEEKFLRACVVAVRGEAAYKGGVEPRFEANPGNVRHYHNL
jgi:hypothetical protein